MSYRFAPSPTGDMHLGNLRVALLNYICAKQDQKKLLIRIEDTDKKRNIKDKDIEILKILDTFEIKYDEVYYQSNNLKYHQKIGFDLLTQKKAFNCFCTDEQLKDKKEISKQNKIPYRYDDTCLGLSDEEVLDNQNPSSIRLTKPKNNIEFTDIVKSTINFNTNEIDSFVILRTDKTPTYNFACAVDDMLMDASVVIRGEDHVSNTPKQIHIRNSIGYDSQIQYAHLPIILNSDGKKMSKRDEASSVEWLLEEGFLPSAITNYVVSLGFSAPNEIFDIQDALKWFDLQKVSKNPAKFDIDKLRFINRAHINKSDNLLLASKLGFSKPIFGEIAKFFTQEGSTLKEIKPKIDAIVSKKTSLKDYEQETEVLRTLLQKEKYEDFDELKKYLMKESGLKGMKLFKPLRYLLTGASNGPNLSDIYPLIKDVFVTE
ncbi:MAG: Glutamyl-tRNA(Gln) synthetase (EC [uncultured Campylobacterales bacterium]|uniref:Glutamate--tRNA ligase n=1 Tax=uncultured Campylobacterales bacterium TaxID=352960 RepID=A0A6S6SLU6_9BACT|nr:MAG: Glutamyl-tRNA(Gln) synthetase (EC [uncultured Campylobacterales bacterium]